MATRQELEAALRAADKAGNVEDAKRLADAIRNFKNTPNVDAVRDEFAQMPWYQKAATATDDTVRFLANGLTLGWADNFAGNMSGTGTEAQNQITEEARARAGSAAPAAEILGMLLPASRISQGVGGVTGLTATTVGESAMREGIAGGLTSLISALSDTSDPGELTSSAGLGVLAGGIGGAVGSKLGDAFDWAGRKLGITNPALVDDIAPRGTVDDLMKSKDQAYDVVERMGTRYDPDGYMQMVDDLDSSLAKLRFDPERHTNVAHVMNKEIRSLPNRSTGGIRPVDIDDMRQVVNEELSNVGGREPALAKNIRSTIDGFIDNGATTTGGTANSPAEAGRALRGAREANRRVMLARDVENVLYRGENAASPRGDVNALRSYINNPNNRRFMKAPELKAAERVVRGEGMENLLNNSVVNSPFTPLSLGISTGYMTGNPLLGVAAGGAASAGPALLKHQARKYTDASMDRFLDTIMGGGRTPSAMRGVVGPLGQAVAVDALEEDQRKARKKRRN